MTAIYDETAAGQAGGYGYRDLRALMALMTGDAKHSNAATSTLDVLWVLYDRVMRVTPATADANGRDRFLLSKGHGPAAYYAVLAAKGFIPVRWLAEFGAFDSPLGYHPDRMLIPGVEISSGSLGHGLPLGVGLALGLRARGLAERTGSGAGDPAGARVFVLVGDAELDEGSNHEAIAFAAAARLDSLQVVVVDNDSSTHGWPGGIAARFELEGWSAATVSGRDHEALTQALTTPHPGRPRAVVAVVEPASSEAADRGGAADVSRVAGPGGGGPGGGGPGGRGRGGRDPGGRTGGGGRPGGRTGGGGRPGGGATARGRDGR